MNYHSRFTKVLSVRLNEHIRWVEDPENHALVALTEMEIYNYLKCSTPLPWTQIAEAVRRLATWHGIKGLALIKNNNKISQVEIYKSYVYNILALRIVIGEIRKKRHLGFFEVFWRLTRMRAPSHCV